MVGVCASVASDIPRRLIPPEVWVLIFWPGISSTLRPKQELGWEVFWVRKEALYEKEKQLLLGASLDEETNKRGRRHILIGTRD